MLMSSFDLSCLSKLTKIVELQKFIFENVDNLSIVKLGKTNSYLFSF